VQHQAHETPGTSSGTANACSPESADNSPARIGSSWWNEGAAQHDNTRAEITEGDEMTPLIAEMVRLSPEPEKAMWFDVGQTESMDAMRVPADVLMHPPFPRTAIVGLDTTGKKFALWLIAGDHSITIGGVTGAAQYMKPFAIFETEEGLRYYKGDLEIQQSDVQPAVRMALYCLLKIESATAAFHPVATNSPTNARRVAKGKPPLIYDWHTVKLIPNGPPAEHQGGTHATPRRHQCRGHWRNCKSGKRVWVKDCWRGDASKGTVFKDYKA